MHLTDEAQMVREMVRGFAENELRPIAAEIDRDERFPHESIEQMRELGFTYRGMGRGYDSDG